MFGVLQTEIEGGGFACAGVLDVADLGMLGVVLIDDCCSLGIGANG